MPSTVGTSPKLPFKEKADAGLHSSHSLQYLIQESVPRVGRVQDKVARLEWEEVCPSHSENHPPSGTAPAKGGVWMPAGGGARHMPGGDLSQGAG